jgi:pimeloyl-ACP methyl ester carboxylesterase
MAVDQEPSALERAVAAIRDRPDSTEAVTDGIPLLVVGGDADPLIPPVVEEQLAGASPNGRVEILEGCGHVPSMERPDEFNGILAAFLASL